MTKMTVRRWVVIFGGLTCLAIGLLTTEIYLTARATLAADELDARIASLRQTNRRVAAEIQGIKASESRISALWVRLNDAVFNQRRNDQPSAGVVSHRNRGRGLEERPEAAQQLTDAGFVVHPGRSTNGEVSAVYEAGSSRLELHRIVPVLAEQENSNAFLFFDRVFLSRPPSTPPFSSEPTYLESRLSIRVLTAR
jgi:uncharacterized small protein (DUF1192 family)